MTESEDFDFPDLEITPPGLVKVNIKDRDNNSLGAIWGIIPPGLDPEETRVFTEGFQLGVQQTLVATGFAESTEPTGIWHKLTEEDFEGED